MWRKARTFAVLLVALLAVAPAWAAGSPIGQIKKVSGTVLIVRGSDHLPAKPGTPVYQGDVIETGPDGSVGVTLIDNSVFSAGPSSQLALPEFKFDTNNSRGSMLADLKKGTLSVVSGVLKSPCASMKTMPTRSGFAVGPECCNPLSIPKSPLQFASKPIGR